jgi:hypothetical protein
VVVHACNPSTQRLRQEDFEFEASLGYIVRPWLKRNKDTDLLRMSGQEKTHCVNVRRDMYTKQWILRIREAKTARIRVRNRQITSSGDCTVVLPATDRTQMKI